MEEFKLLETKFKEMQEALFQYLRVNKLIVHDKNITEMVKTLNQVQTIVPGHQYIGLKTNDKGYVIGYEVFDKVVDLQPVPEDIQKQYYKVDKYGRFSVDKEKRERFWGEE
jgi:hypothetical protein